MSTFIKRYYKTLAFFALIGIIGGFFTGLYLLDSYPPEIKTQLADELQSAGLGSVSVDLVTGVLTAIQSAIYGALLGAVGIFLAKKVGLWRDERSITKRPLIKSLVIATVSGLALIFADILFFGHYSEVIAVSYETKPTVTYMLASVTYGAVIEEVMLRLFFMSLVAFVIFRLLGKGSGRPAMWMMVLANVVSALLFAAGHLPATVMMIGTTPMIIFRCFLLNGGLGLLFGWLYRRYGLRYAMIAHGGCHIVSKLIWILFV